MTRSQRYRVVNAILYDLKVNGMLPVGRNDRMLAKELDIFEAMHWKFDEMPDDEKVAAVVRWKNPLGETTL